jgi:hypothetical protein
MTNPLRLAARPRPPAVSARLNTAKAVRSVSFRKLSWQRLLHPTAAPRQRDSVRTRRPGGVWPSADPRCALGARARRRRRRGTAAAACRRRSRGANAQRAGVWGTQVRAARVPRCADVERGSTTPAHRSVGAAERCKRDCAARLRPRPPAGSTLLDCVCRGRSAAPACTGQRAWDAAPRFGKRVRALTHAPRRSAARHAARGRITEQTVARAVRSAACARCGIAVAARTAR